MASARVVDGPERPGSLLTLSPEDAAILDALAATPASRGLSHAMLARQLHVQRSTLYRYLAALVQLGLVETDADAHRYRLGPRLLVLGAAALGEHAFLRHARASSTTSPRRRARQRTPRSSTKASQ